MTSVTRVTLWWPQRPPRFQPIRKAFLVSSCCRGPTAPGWGPRRHLSILSLSCLLSGGLHYSRSWLESSLLPSLEPQLPDPLQGCVNTGLPGRGHILQHTPPCHIYLAKGTSHGSKVATGQRADATGGGPASPGPSASCGTSQLLVLSLRR